MSAVLSQAVAGYLERSSWIRRMFEAGIELKARFGVEHVFDFSLGNPDVAPPPGTADALEAIARVSRRELAFGYCPNAGLPDARRDIAAQIAGQQRSPVEARHVVLTCGAAGGLNVALRAILDPGDEVIGLAPYFVEYGFYAANHGGVLKVVPTRADTFDIDLDAIGRALGPRTRAIIVNSPNNPSGAVYDAASLCGLGELLREHSRRVARPVFLISDEPYRFLVYDGVEVPPVLPAYEYSVVVGSLSKSHSIAGERVGYVCPSPAMPESARLIDGLVLANRILGFVNAPVIGQMLLSFLKNEFVDVGIYAERRKAMAAMLRDAGVEFVLPRGAFYFFPKVPDSSDDTGFVGCLREHNVLAVPGVGFGCPGYFRLTFCMNAEIIRRAAAPFCRAIADWRERIVGAQGQGRMGL